MEHVSVIAVELGVLEQRHVRGYRRRLDVRLFIDYLKRRYIVVSDLD